MGPILVPMFLLVLIYGALLTVCNFWLWAYISWNFLFGKSLEVTEVTTLPFMTTSPSGKPLFHGSSLQMESGDTVSSPWL